MRWRVGLAALVVGLVAASAPSFAEWRFEYRTGPDPRTYRSYRPYDRMPFGYGPMPRQRCWIEVQRDPWGYREVRRCRPGRGYAYGRRPGYFWDMD